MGKAKVKEVTELEILTEALKDKGVISVYDLQRAEEKLINYEE